MVTLICVRCGQGVIELGLNDPVPIGTIAHESEAACIVALGKAMHDLVQFTMSHRHPCGLFDRTGEPFAS